MILYDKNKWWLIAVAFKGTVVKRMLFRIMLLLLLTIMLAVLQHRGYAIPPVNSTMHTLLGTGLSLLLVFRTNSSYDRYWEGRKLLGSITNNNRNLLRTATCCYRGKTEDVLVLVQYMYGFITGLKHTLRAHKDPAEYEELIKERSDLEKITGFHNGATASIFLAARWIHAQVEKGLFERWEARSLETYLANLTESQGGLERIAFTPIPFAYAAHTHQFLWLYLITLPFTMVDTYQYYAMVAVFTISFGFIGIDEAGVEIEDPFGHDDNDLPLELIFGNVIKDAKGLVELYGVKDDAESSVLNQSVGGAGESSSLVVQIRDKETAPDDAE